MEPDLPVIAVMGASGLIGEAVASGLMHEGFPVVPVARRFTAAQKRAFGAPAEECPVVALEAGDLADFLSRRGVGVIVNCIGVLQDGPRGATGEAHGGFMARLLSAMEAQAARPLLVHLSIPGRDDDDATPFSLSKREAERLIARSARPHVILRPGFVIAPAAYGGSALVRALAGLPFGLPDREAARPFAATAVADITRTVAALARRWGQGERDWAARWDVMETQPSTVGDVVDAFRAHFGGPRAVFSLPSWLMALGAWAGDLAAHLGWTPPIRTTALMEMRRGVEGDPAPWIAATGIRPSSLGAALADVPATVQEAWFARLYLLKGLVIASLAMFWVVSGLIALTVAFAAAASILVAHGVPQGLANAVTAVTSLADIAIGTLIALRRTTRAGLLAGIGLSLCYMAGAVVLTPELWIDPLGPLVKTGPAIILMLVALALERDR